MNSLKSGDSLFAIPDHIHGEPEPPESEPEYFLSYRIVLGHQNLLPGLRDRSRGWFGSCNRRLNGSAQVQSANGGFNESCGADRLGQTSRELETAKLRNRLLIRAGSQQDDRYHPLPACGSL
jgi:hypothetical protein